MSRKRIEAIERRRDEINTRLTELDDLVIERSSDFTDAERTEYEGLEAELGTVTAPLEGLIKREADIERSRTLGASLGKATNADDGDPTKAGKTVDDGAGAEPIYRADAQTNFFLDIHRAKSGIGDAAERINAHRVATLDILRATATSDLGGLIVPKYLVDKYQPLAVAKRHFINSLMGTPAYGEKLTTASAIIPQETVGPGQGPQATQNTAFSTANWATTGLTLNAVTVGGYSDVSVQAIQLGQVRQERVFQEMMDRYYADQERQALWGSGASGEVEGVFLADGTQTISGGYSATAFAEIYGIVQQAASKVEIADEREALFVLMSPGRWRSLMSATDNQGRPLHGDATTAPMNVGAFVDGSGQKWFGGLKAVVSSKVVKAGEDDTVMAVYNPDFAYFEESDPYTVSADQVVIHTGTIRYVNYGFMMFSPEVRVNSLCLIQNLGVPAFPMAAIS